jgi:hypothetical protein
VGFDHTLPPRKRADTCPENHKIKIRNSFDGFGGEMHGVGFTRQVETASLELAKVRKEYRNEGGDILGGLLRRTLQKSDPRSSLEALDTYHILAILGV